MEGKTLNIPSTIEDPSYRYKMPALQLRTEGRLNGVKTKIVNLEDIAKAIRVPPAYPLKFMGYELGTQLSESNMVINGDFKEPELRKLLDKFIEKYVLCPGCHYPEMVIKVKKGDVTGHCNSCGWKDRLDNAHKLAAYIIKNPPKNVSEFKKDEKADDSKKNVKDEAKEKKSSKKDTKKAGEEKADEEVKEADKENEKEKKEEKPKEEPKSQLYDFKSNEDQLASKVRETYKKYSNLESFEDQDSAIHEIIEATKNLEVPIDHKNKLSYLIFLAIFDLNIAKEVSRNSAILKKAQEEFDIDYPEQDILMNLEKFLTAKNDFSVYEKYVPTILKLFYDDDLLSEEYLIEWFDGKHNSKLMMDYRFDVEKDKRFKLASKPFIEWLKNAETE